MRRKVGVSVVTSKKGEKDQYNKIGKSLEENKLATVREMTSKFKTSLAEFATKHKDRINSDPEFRHQFHKMCISVGVDPLASSKGFWADILGVGDFYFELGVKIIQIALQTRSANGGIMSLLEMVQRLNEARNQSRGHRNLISDEDVHRAVDKISALGNGFRILKIGGKRMILSVPLEISNDVEILMTVSRQFNGRVANSLMKRSSNWSDERFRYSMAPLLSEGMVWIDGGEGAEEELAYFFPSIWKECQLDDASLPGFSISSPSLSQK